MKNIYNFFKTLCGIAGLITSCMCYATNSIAIETQANQYIDELYHRVKLIPNTSFTDRINWFSAQFKDVPYVLGSLGEGPNARYDQFPRYRVDGFDCDTYVNTVLALVFANSLESFQQCLKFTRYHNGKVAYIHRNHFTSIDWNLNNQQRGILKDITLDIKDKNDKVIALFANAVIDKSNWYAYKTNSNIRLQQDNRVEQEKRLMELKNKGAQLGIVVSKIPYIPLTALFDEKNNPNLYLFSQIPQGAIIEIIRPNWDLRKLIGTSLNVSHLGFAIWIDKKLYFRQASSNEGKVADVPLIPYLLEARKSPTIKGINVQIVLPVKISAPNCSVVF